MSHTTFRILGVDINFPFQPYGIQKGMFGKLLTTLTNREHLLLESPTGTGKTLVLLCSALSWQTKSKELKHPLVSARYRKKLAEERREHLSKRPCTCGRRPTQNDLDELKEAKENNLKKGRKCSDPLDDDGSCLKKAKVETEDLKSSPYFNSEKEKTKDDDIIILDDKFCDDQVQIIPGPENSAKLCESCRALQVEEVFSDEFEDEAPSSKITRIPRIYYGTRTHKQISQVIRELNKTPYKKDLRMCILSSRERTCINEEVKDLPNRNDKCQDLIRNSGKTSMGKKKRDDGCLYHPDSAYVHSQFEVINDEYNSKAWDIEDAAKFGQNHGACPYYGVRSLQETADITFCPYNYLLDPNIRSTLNINLSGAVIIIDEAHNIEDICRESASFVIDTKQIDDIIETMRVASTQYVQGSNIHDAYNFFRDKLLNIKSFLQKLQFTENEKQISQECIARKVMNQTEMSQALKILDLGPKNLKDVKENLKALKGDEDEDQPRKNDEQSAPALSFNQLQFLQQLTMTLDFMYSRESKYLNDFRLVITEFLERDFFRFKQAAGVTDDGDTHLWQFSLLCMNPGVTFEQVSAKAWSIIVASGTLSPIDSLKSELGCEFKNDFEGAHVIPASQIFATILTHGPSGVDLNCAYSNSLRLAFQDEVGAVIRDVCKTVPNGVLCFFPSYDRMENFYKRWFDKGYIREIQRAGKKLFREKKNLSAADFEKELNSYNHLAKTKGALLFAVFRGKVSEGIDFADKAARAVITIGIPYPNFKEITVDLKKGYNDEIRRKKPQLMSGGDWYAAQGFRALNQALGRCIRHQRDWGAIIMIDSRLRQNSSLNNISKWLRQVLRVPKEYGQLPACLRTFVQERAEADNQNKLNSIFVDQEEELIFLGED